MKTLITIIASIILTGTSFFSEAQNTTNTENHQVVQLLTHNFEGQMKMKRSVRKARLEAMNRKVSERSLLVETNSRLQKDNEDNAKAKAFNILNLNTYNRVDLTAGLINHTIDQGNRFYLIEEGQEEMNSSIATLDSREVSEELSTSLGDTIVLSFNYNEANASIEKEYRIRDGKYEYKDGYALSGSDELLVRFIDGYKPLTESSFYHMVTRDGKLTNNISLKEFFTLNLEEQAQLLNSNGYTVQLEMK